MARQPRRPGGPLPPARPGPPRRHPGRRLGGHQRRQSRQQRGEGLVHPQVEATAPAQPGHALLQSRVLVERRPDVLRGRRSVDRRLRDGGQAPHQGEVAHPPVLQPAPRQERGRLRLQGRAEGVGGRLTPPGVPAPVRRGTPRSRVTCSGRSRTRRTTGPCRR
ncbi:hypothetical protein SGPA1_11636 [Streptomyces misionensis JCM 4497]